MVVLPDPITFNRKNQEEDYRHWVAMHRSDGLIVVKDSYKWRVHHAYCPHIIGPINQGKNLLTYHKICSTNLVTLENEARKHNGQILTNCPACHRRNEIQKPNDKIPKLNTSLRRLRVFLCHSSGDKRLVRQLYQRLKSCNVDSWLDEENLLPGQNWEHEIRNAVRASDVVIVCLSIGSISKTGFVQKEIKFALDVADEQPEGTIFLIPLKLEECIVPHRLSHLHWVNLYEENGYKKLLHALQKRAATLNVIAPGLEQVNEDATSPKYISCFISYSSKDEAFAKQLYTDLQTNNVRCWFAPEDMKIGDKIRPRLDESIRIYDKILLVLSEYSVASTWVEFEVETAMDKEQEGKPPVLFPVRLDNTVMESTTAWAAHIKRTRHIGDFTRWKSHDDYQKAFARLLRDLKAQG